MRKLATLVLAGAFGVGAVACQKGTDKPKKQDKPTTVTPNQPAKTDTPNNQAGARGPSKKPLNPRAQKDWSKEFPAPPDVKAPPADSTKTKSGLAHKLVSKGKGDKKVGQNDTVTMNFTVWKTDGKLYFSTHQRKRPLTIPLGKAPPGWVEALQLMSVGEKRRFWMPPELGFRKGAPNAQMLVYEIELIEVKEGPKPPEDLAGPPASAKRTKSGIRYRVLAKGTGKDKPNAWDQVTYEHAGWTKEGKLFDGSQMGRRRMPPTFPYKLSVGLEEVLGQMVVGQKVRAWIPQELAKMGGRPMPEGALVYDLELKSVKKMHKPPPTPRDVAKPPADAKKTAKGVFYKVLKKGTGSTKPGRTQRVKVHYTGWTTDGRMFDSSVVRGQPSEFPLNRVIPGWTDGLQIMVEGETTRFWIPFELAYKGQPNRPQGMLVFDVQLIEIKK